MWELISGHILKRFLSDAGLERHDEAHDRISAGLYMNSSGRKEAFEVLLY